MSAITDTMIDVQQTEEFEEWLDDLADRKARTVIVNRIIQIEGGLMGRTKSLGDKVGEIKIDYGPGYRLYFTKLGKLVIILLCGGDKGSQNRDIKKAKGLAAQV